MAFLWAKFGTLTLVSYIRMSYLSKFQIDFLIVIVQFHILFNIEKESRELILCWMDINFSRKWYLVQFIVHLITQSIEFDGDFSK